MTWARSLGHFLRKISKADTGEFRPADGAGLCLAVGPASRTAGPFMARDLILADCADTEPARKQWVVKTAN